MKQQYPEPIVGAFIFNTEGKIFLIKTHKWKDMWCVPGGHIEVGETIDQALKREVKEETNLEITNPQFFGVEEYLPDGSYWKAKHFLFLNYRVEAVSDHVKLNHEAEEYGWFSLEDALKLPLEKYTRKTIEEHLHTNVSE